MTIFRTLKQRGHQPTQTIVPALRTYVETRRSPAHKPQGWDSSHANDAHTSVRSSYKPTKRLRKRHHDLMNTFTTSDGVKLTYEDHGSGRPIVYLPGYTGNHHQVIKQRQSLVDNGMRLIALNHRGHGDSDLPKYGLRVSRLGQDLAELLEHLDLTDTVLLAHSMGTSVSLAYFSQAHAPRVSALVAIEQSPKIVNDETWSYGVRSIDWSNAYAAACFKTDWSSPNAEPPMPPEVELAYKTFAEFPHEQMRPLLVDHYMADWRDVLPRIEIPVLVAVGGRSPFYTIEGQQWFADAMPKGELAVFHESGHFPHMNETDVFNQRLLEFLAQTVV